MDQNIFNPKEQEKNISSKIVAALERISEVFKVLLWEKAKVAGLSPIQIQILIFITYHKQELCNVSHLAKEFNLTKPTISDAIRVLNEKALITKDFSPSDSRRYYIQVSDAGKKVVEETEDFANPLKEEIEGFGDVDLANLFKALSELIYQLNSNQILTVQRTCYGCTFHKRLKNKHYCKLMERELSHSEIRLDCPEYEEKAV